MAPEGIDKYHWTSFVDYRLDERTKERECGHKVSRGEVWISTHQKTNKDFVSDEARKTGEKIKAYESTTSSQSKKKSSSDSLAHALGIQEHCGRTRSLGLAPCPSIKSLESKFVLIVDHLQLPLLMINYKLRYLH